MPRPYRRDNVHRSDPQRRRGKEEAFEEVIRQTGRRLPRRSTPVRSERSHQQRSDDSTNGRERGMQEIKAAQFGMRTAAVEKVKSVCMDENVRIQMRPTNLESARWIRLGFSKKPHDVVTKSVNEVDTTLGRLMRAGGIGGGPAEKTEGLIGFYRPLSEDDLVRLYEQNKDKIPRHITLEQLRKKRSDRDDEYDRNKDSIRQLDAEIPPIVRRGKGEYEGLLLDARPPERQGRAQFGTSGYLRPFTGDFDGFDILTQENGEWVSLAEAKKNDPNGPLAKRYDRVLAKLMDSTTVQLQHGYHLAWDIREEAQRLYPDDPEAQRALIEKYTKIDQGVRAKHTQEGGEPLLDIYPDGLAAASFYES